jgi:MFS family permease
MAANDPAAVGSAGRRFGCVGCLTTVAGFFSGGMIAVFVAKVVGSVEGCKPAEGLPACNWWVYAGIGAVLGAFSLPILALWRLKQTRSDE